MMYFVRRKRSRFAVRIISALILTAFVSNLAVPSQLLAQTAIQAPRPAPIAAPVIMPPVLSGLTVSSDNPLQFDFIVDKGLAPIAEDQLKKESIKLIKYFLASVTIPDDNQWVNLSPYEKERIIPEDFGSTEMGRDLLLQDYFLKQFTAVLNNPEHELGKQFWKRVQDKAYKLFGTRDIPLSTFNKVWITPDKASIFETGNTAYILESHLKVMLEEDQVSLNSNAKDQNITPDQLRQVSKLSSQIMKEVIVPEIEREVNTGKTFINLRQIYNSMILATWYKENLKGSLLNRVYANKSKVKGIDLEDKQAKQKVYQQYLAAFKKGAYNVIKEEYDPDMQDTIYRKYVSGGFARTNRAMMALGFGDLAEIIRSQLLGPKTISPAQLAQIIPDPARYHRVETAFVENLSRDAQPVQPSAAPTPAPAANTKEKSAWLESIAEMIRKVDQVKVDGHRNALVLWEKRQWGDKPVTLRVVNGHAVIEENTPFSRMAKILDGILTDIGGLEGLVVLEDGSSFGLNVLLAADPIPGIRDRQSLNIEKIEVHFSDSAKNALTDNQYILARRIETFLYSLLVEVFQIPVPGANPPYVDIFPHDNPLMKELREQKIETSLRAVDRLLRDLSVDDAVDKDNIRRKRIVLWKHSAGAGGEESTWDEFNAGSYFSEEVAQRLGLVSQKVNIDSKAGIVLTPDSNGFGAEIDVALIAEKVRAYLTSKQQVLRDMQGLWKKNIEPLDIDPDDAGDAAMMASNPTMEVRNKTAFITLNAPVLNAAHVDELIKMVDDVASGRSGDVKALVLTAGKNFSYGADIKTLMLDSISKDPAVRAKSIQFYTKEKELHDKIQALSAQGITTVTLARGYTIGGGMGIAAVTDFIVTDDSTRISMPEVKLGLLPDVGATWFLPRRMGVAAGKYFGLTGTTMTGKEAVGLGLAQGHVDSLADFGEKLKALINAGPVTKDAVRALIQNNGRTQKDLQADVADLKAKAQKYFNFGQHNQGYLADIFKALEQGASEGDIFAQKALAAMRSAAGQSIWLAEFLIDTFSPEREEFVRKHNPSEAFTQAEARNLELKFAQEMTGSPWYFEGVAGFMSGFISGKFSTHLDRIILTDHKGFRKEIEAQNIDNDASLEAAKAAKVGAGSRLDSETIVEYEGEKYILPVGEYHAGQKLIKLQKQGDPSKTVQLRIDLRNSQWSDQQVFDELEAIRGFAEPGLGSRILKRAWLANPEKMELDIVYKYAWEKGKRPSRAADLSKYPLNSRFPDGKLNPAKAIFDQIRANPDGEKLLDDIKVINIDDNGERSISYRQLEHDVYEMAHTLKRLGVGPGKTVLIYMSTTYEGMVVQLATALTGAVPHYLFSSKEADVLSYSQHYMGADLIITEDGYRQGNKTVRLKQDKVDKVLERFMPTKEFQQRLTSALDDLQDGQLSVERERVVSEIKEVLEPQEGQAPSTYSRDDIQNYLQTTHTAYIREVVGRALSAKPSGKIDAVAFEERLMARAEAIDAAKGEVEEAEAHQALWVKYKDILKKGLAKVSSQPIENDQQLAQALIKSWLVVMRGIKGDAIPYKDRNFLKDHVRLVAQNKVIPTVQSLLSDEDNMALADFIVKYAKEHQIDEKDLEPIQRYDQVRNRIIAEFEEPYDPNVKVLVYNRLKRMGFVDDIPMKPGRDIFWDEAVAQTRKEIDTDEKLFGFPVHIFNGDDPILLSFSSGSTGTPKGILTEASALFATAQSMRNSFGLAPHQKHLTITDYGWIVGPAYSLWAPLLEGRSFILQSFTVDAKNPQKTLEVLKKHGVSFFKAGSPFYDDFFASLTPQQVEEFLGTLLREGGPAICGCAAPFSHQTFRLMQNLIGQNAIMNSLWPTETAGSVNATFSRRPSVEQRMFEKYGSLLLPLLGDEAAVKEAIARVRKPISIDQDDPDILPFPWTNQWVIEKLQNAQEEPIPNPQRITRAINEGPNRGTESSVGQLVHAGLMMNHTLGLMKSRKGVPGPAVADAKYFGEKYFNHDFETEFPGRGRGDIKRKPLDTGDIAYQVTRWYDPNDPFDALILDGPEDPVTPVTYYAAGRAGRQTGKVSGHFVNAQDYERILDSNPKIRKAAVPLIASGDRRGLKPFILIALKPGYVPDDKLTDEILTELRTRLGAHVAPEKTDIVFLPFENEPYVGRETFLPYTRTNKVMHEVIAYLAEKDLESLKVIQKFLRDPELRVEMRTTGQITRLRSNSLFRGMPDTQNLGFALTISNLVDRIIVAREGAKFERPKFDPASPQFDRFANVPEDLIQPLGGNVLRPGDPVLPFQAFIGVARNADGMGMENRDISLGLRRGVRETPKLVADGVLVQLIKSGNTHNVENLGTGDPTSQIGDKPEHVGGDAGVGVVVGLSPQAENRGTFDIGDLVIVDPMVFNRHHPGVTRNAQTDSLIGGYQGGGDQGTFQPLAVFDSGSLYPVPVGMSASLAATLLLNAPTVYHALFSDEKLNLRPDDVLLIHGGTSDTAKFAIPMATALGVKLLVYVKDEKAGQQVQAAYPDADMQFLYYGKYPDLLKTVPVDAPEALTKWLADMNGLLANIPAGYQPTRVMGFLGGDYKAVDLRILAPSERGNAIAWFSGMLGFYSTFVPFNGSLEANEALGEYGANVQLGQNGLIMYGANADADGRDEKAIAAIKEAARLGARVVVMTETDQQYDFLLADPEVKNLVQNQAVSEQTLRKQGIVIPPHFPDIDEGRSEKGEAHETYPGRAAEDHFVVQIVSKLKKVLSNNLKWNTNTSQLFDFVWYSGKRDRFALGTYLSQPQTGQIVLGETQSDVIQTGHESQSWFNQRNAIFPAGTEELRKEFGDNVPVRAKMIRVAGSHMYEPHEAQATLRDLKDRKYKFGEPDHLLPQSEIEAALGRKQKGEVRGSMAFNIVEENIETEEDLLRAQGIEVVKEFGLVRLLRSTVGENGESIAILDINDRTTSNPNPKAQDANLRNNDLNYFKDDFVNQLRALLEEIRNHPDIYKVALIKSSSTRAFMPGQNTTELKTLTPEQVAELAALAQDTISQIESFDIPVGLHLGGLALGGGAELAGGAHYVVASNLERTRIGQVESVIGLPPGFGGTQRLVRIIADNSKLSLKERILAALDFILTGDHMTMPEAYMHGIVSELVPANSWRVLYKHAVGHILGTDDTLQNAMEKRHASLDRWEQPLVDAKGKLVDLSFIDKDPDIQRYLSQADKVGQRGKIYRAILNLVKSGLAKGVRYGDESKTFGKFAGTLQFRQAEARLFARSKNPTPPRRARSLKELALLRQIAAEVNAKPIIEELPIPEIEDGADDRADMVMMNADDQPVPIPKKLKTGDLDQEQWKGKVVIVTGGGANLGKEITFELAKRGSNVIIDGRRKDVLERTRDEVAMGKDKGEVRGEVLVVPGDVTDNQHLRDLFAQGVKKFGRVDGVIGNAGGPGEVKPLFMIPTSRFRKGAMTHLATWKTTSLLRKMMEEERAAGINLPAFATHLGSFYAPEEELMPRPYPFRSDYTGPQAKKTGLSRVAAHNLRFDNLYSLVVNPGPFTGERVDRYVYANGERIRKIVGYPKTAQEIRADTEAMHPRGRFVTPRDVAGLVVDSSGEEVRIALNGGVVSLGGIHYDVPPSNVPPVELGLRPDLQGKKIVLIGINQAHAKLAAIARGLFEFGAEVTIATQGAETLKGNLGGLAVQVQEVDVGNEQAVSKFFQSQSSLDHVVTVTGEPQTETFFHELELEQIDDLVERFYFIPTTYINKYSTAVMIYRGLQRAGEITDPRVATFDEFMKMVERNLDKEPFDALERAKFDEIFDNNVPVLFDIGDNGDRDKFYALVKRYLSDTGYDDWTDAERSFMLTHLKKIFDTSTSERDKTLLAKLISGIGRVWTAEERAILQNGLRASIGQLTVVGPEYTDKDILKRLRLDIFRMGIMATFTTVAMEMAMMKTRINVNVVFPGTRAKGPGTERQLQNTVKYLASDRGKLKNGLVLYPDERNAATDWQQPPGVKTPPQVIRKVNLDTRSVVVTGGAINMGKSIATKLAGAGAEVIPAARNEATLKAATDGIKAAGGKASYVQADLTDHKQIKKLADEIIRMTNELGRKIDLVNNSGVAGTFARTDEISLQDINPAAQQFGWNSTMQINFHAPLELMARLIALIRKQGGGSIQNIVTLYAYLGYIARSVYVGSKAAFGAFSLALAEELKKEGIYITNIQPSLIKGERLDLVLRNNIRFFMKNGVLTPEIIARLNADIDGSRKQDPKLDALVKGLEAKTETEIPRDVLKPIAWFWTQIAKSTSEITAQESDWGRPLTSLTLYFKSILPLDPPSNDDVGNMSVRIAEDPKAFAGRNVFVSGLPEVQEPKPERIVSAPLELAGTMKDKNVLLVVPSANIDMDKVKSLIDSYLKAGAAKIVIADQGGPRELVSLVSDKVEIIMADFSTEDGIATIFGLTNFAAGVYLMPTPSKDEMFSDIYLDPSIVDLAPEALEARIVKNRLMRERFDSRFLTSPMLFLREASRKMDPNGKMVFIVPQSTNLEGQTAIATIVELSQVRNKEKEIIGSGVASAVLESSLNWTSGSADYVVNLTREGVADSAMMADTDTTAVGGIRLDSKLLDLQIKRDGNGIPLPLNLQPLQNMNIQGFAPVILNIQPVNVRLILGLADEPGSGSDYSLDVKPQPYIKPEKQQGKAGAKDRRDLSLAR